MFQYVRGHAVNGHSFVSDVYEKADGKVSDDAIAKSIVGFDANTLYFSAIGGNIFPQDH